MCVAWGGCIAWYSPSAWVGIGICRIVLLHFISIEGWNVCYNMSDGRIAVYSNPASIDIGICQMYILYIIFLCKAWMWDRSACFITYFPMLKECIFLSLACAEMSDRGPCRGLINRYYFNPQSQTCEVFIFGGCGGNCNNFNNITQCEETCNDGMLY